MKSQNTSTLISIVLSSSELWYLAQRFGPGWVYGIENPTDNLSVEQLSQLNEDSQKSLSKAGLIKSINENQIQVDGILSGMIYSCLHSSNMMIVESKKNGTKLFFHFLPQWQMELNKVDNDYELTLFKQRGDLFQHILFSQDITLSEFNINGKFSIGSKDLEMATFMYVSGKKGSANDLLGEVHEGLLQPDKFLMGYLSPDFHLTFDMLYHREDEERTHSRRNELLQMNGTLFWISHDDPSEEAQEMMNFISITPSQAEKRFNQMLPKN